MTSIFEKKLLKIKNDNNFRELQCVFGVDFSSNDYLGLSNHPKIKKTVIEALNSGVSVGAGGARLLTGNKKEHTELEIFAADYFNVEKSLFFSSGFIANYAIFTTLPDRKDFIIYDELSHASIRDGIKASDAKSIKFKHNDLNSLKEKVQKANDLDAKFIWIAVESVYSMDGDIADLNSVLDIVNNHENIYLIVDEAHATGIFGTDGKGFTYGLNHDKMVTLHTCGKALGVSGALVCASDVIIQYMINKSRPFIFTTAESPLIAVAVKEALIVAQEEKWRRKKLLELIEYTHNRYSNFIKLPSKTQIIPILCNSSEDALIKAKILQEKGFDIRAIRPPTVQTPRLRLSLNVNREKSEIDRLFENIKLIKE